MTRGHQKAQAKEKAAQRAAAHTPGKSQLGARAAGLTIKCPTCLASMANYKLLVQHMEAKHPRDKIPDESTLNT